MKRVFCVSWSVRGRVFGFAKLFLLCIGNYDALCDGVGAQGEEVETCIGFVEWANLA